MNLHKGDTQIHKVFHISGRNMELGRERSGEDLDTIGDGKGVWSKYIIWIKLKQFLKNIRYQQLIDQLADIQRSVDIPLCTLKFKSRDLVLLRQMLASYEI